MMKRRITTVAIATLTVLMLFGGTAFAHYCTNVSKKAGAGNAGALVFVLDGWEDEEPDVDFARTTVKMNKRGQVTGGFMDIVLTFTDGTPDMVLADLYAHAGLPHHALLAAGCGRATETQLPFFEEYCPPGS